MITFIIFVAVFLAHAARVQSKLLVTHPIPVDGVTMSGSGANTCPSNQDLSDAKNSLQQNISALLNDVGCGGAGWRRVGYLDMKDPAQSCPSGLRLWTYDTPVRGCGRVSDPRSCWSTVFNTGSLQYSRVCGRVQAYRFGACNAFHAYHVQNKTIDSYYVDGVSLTHGPAGSRTHIWTFAASTAEPNRILDEGRCPCEGSHILPPPPFVGNDYFCESGDPPLIAYRGRTTYAFYPEDPLWDGQKCVPSCCQHNNPPYFTKTLPAPTSNNIELRVCLDSAAIYDNTPIEQLELYVQ